MSDPSRVGHNDKALAPLKRSSTDVSSSSLTVEILQQPAPKLPHEADQSTRNQQTDIRPEILQAADDVAAGLKDTGRAPVVNEVYKRQKKSLP